MTDATRPFAHASEAELARILDFYQVAWEYEPRSFPILWNLEGSVVESFSPDFYLPELDLYLELTTLRQSLVRKKNRKLRRLRELYPMVRIKLFYGKDFRALLLKYGRIGLADSLERDRGPGGRVAVVRRRGGAAATERDHPHRTCRAAVASSQSPPVDGSRTDARPRPHRRRRRGARSRPNRSPRRCTHWGRSCRPTTPIASQRS